MYFFWICSFCTWSNFKSNRWSEAAVLKNKRKFVFDHEVTYFFKKEGQWQWVCVNTEISTYIFRVQRTCKQPLFSSVSKNGIQAVGTSVLYESRSVYEQSASTLYISGVFPCTKLCFRHFVSFYYFFVQIGVKEACYQAPIYVQNICNSNRFVSY